MNQKYESLPGSELVTEGLEDLRAARITESSLLVLIAAPNLIRHGINETYSAYAK
jgi:hypothetical protein